MDDTKSEIERLRYHVKLLGEAVDSQEHPLTSLVVHLNWKEADLDAAHDIFEEFDQKMESDASVNWSDLERRLKDRFDIGYQTVKSIVLAFYRNHQWSGVCRKYAMAHQCTEFHEIIQPNR